MSTTPKNDKNLSGEICGATYELSFMQFSCNSQDLFPALHKNVKCSLLLLFKQCNPKSIIFQATAFDDNFFQMAYIPSKCIFRLRKESRLVRKQEISDHFRKFCYTESSSLACCELVVMIQRFNVVKKLTVRISTTKEHSSKTQFTGE